MPAIPLIDLGEALRPRGARVEAVAAQLRGAAEASGFFYVEGHGVAPELVLRQFATARAFFELAQTEKDAVALERSPARRGYEAIGGQRLDADARPDLKESFYCGIEHAPDHPYVRKGYQSYGANQWPAGLPGMAGQCADYIEAMTELSRRLMALLARSLGLDESWFAPMLDHGGLEVQLPDGSWCAAPPVPGTFVVNLGDMVPRWTGGRYHSNPHRVRNVLSGGRPRYSIPFFFSLDYEARIEPLPGCLAPGATPTVRPCLAGEHLREMYARTYGRGAEPAPAR